MLSKIFYHLHYLQIEILKCYQHRAEPVVVVRNTAGGVERKGACTRAITEIAPAFEERRVAVREVRVVFVPARRARACT